jgi:hypothetical protein
MPKPICVPCQRFYRPHKNGKAFIEAMPVRPGAVPGTSQPESWKPYKLWMGDQWKCQGCGNEIIVGCGGRPIAEHYEPAFEEKVKGVELQINDC